MRWTTIPARTRLTGLAILGAVLLAAIALGVILYLSGAAPEDARSWFQRNAIPLQTAEAGRGFEDLRPLAKIIGDAQVIAMGDATHGTREFLQFKHRVLEWLASESGSNVVALALEADWPACHRLNDYVVSGEGDPDTLLAGLHYWIWQTEEILDMIRWMRAHNADPANTTKVRIYGVDGPAREQTIDRIESYLRRVDPDYASGLTQRLKSQLLALTPSRPYSELQPSERERVSGAISELEQRFQTRREDYITRSSERDWLLHRHDVTVFRQTEEVLRTYKPGLVDGLRDRHMAENVRRIQEFEGPDTQILVWAHNGHVSRSTGNLGQPVMGSWLREIFGPRLVVFGFAFSEGSFRAYDLRSKRRAEFTVGPSLNGSLDAVLASVGPRIFAVDLRPMPGFGRASRWLAVPRSMRSIGASFTCEGEERLVGRFKHQAVLDAHYDALVFIDNTSATRPLPDESPAYERDCTADAEAGQHGRAGAAPAPVAFLPLL